MWGSVQTVRGCPKHCSFCSVWRTDGQKPRQRGVDAVVPKSSSCGARASASSCSPTTTSIRSRSPILRRRAGAADSRQLANLTAIRQERFELMARLAQLPDDLVFYTQITMEAAEDPEFLDAMRRARIRGALVGVESVTPEGLKAVFKDFNDAGDALVTRLQAFREHGVHVLGSFIFGLPTDKPDTFAATAELAQRAGVSFAQFVMLTPFPGTVDFAKWEKEPSTSGTVDGVPLTRYWLIPSGAAAEDLHAASADVARARSASARKRRGTRSTVCRSSGSARRASRRSARGWRSCCSRSFTGRCTPTPGSRPTAPAWRDRRSAPASSRASRAGCSSRSRCRICNLRPLAKASDRR